MLKVLDDESAIKKYRRQFIKSFKPFVNEKIPVNLGHPGATVKAKVSWSDSLGIWMFHEKISDSRYWHAFGVGKPIGVSHIPITCEINIPLRGIDRRIGGTMASGRDGRVYVVHRGKIGGGKKGIGKSLFEDHYRGVWAIMEDGPLDTTVALIGELNSARFVRQVTQFVRKVHRVKDIISFRSSQLEITFDELRFREELIGASHTQPALDLGSMCDHGLIVIDLHDVLSRRGFKTGNDFEHDILIANTKGEITTVFQVITDTSIDKIQSGAGQLLLAGADLPTHPRLILTVPESIDETLKAKLKKLGIEVLVYEWQRDKALFPNLHALMP